MAHKQIHRGMTAEELRTNYGVRFHHFLNTAGRLVATIATEPWDKGAGEDASDEDEIAVALALTSASDTPSRAMGRTVAFGRLEVGKCIILDLKTLKEMIANRTILLAFESFNDKTAQRMGYESAAALLTDLRPRVEFPRTESESEAA